MPKGLLVIALIMALSACTSSNISSVEHFRAARKAGDLDAARAFLADDPRVWYDEKEGDGNAWNLAGGRYKQWDKHFNGHSNPGPWHTEGNTIYRVVEETNDYFKLIERNDTSRYRLTYFFNSDGKITGYMISAANPGKESPPSVSRFDEIETWAKANHSDEWEYLRPGGSLDPTGDRAQRTRILVNKWRATVGLKPIN